MTGEEKSIQERKKEISERNSKDGKMLNKKTKAKRGERGEEKPLRGERLISAPALLLVFSVWSSSLSSLDLWLHLALSHQAAIRGTSLPLLPEVPLTGSQAPLSELRWRQKEAPPAGLCAGGAAADPPTTGLHFISDHWNKVH